MKDQFHRIYDKSRSGGKTSSTPKSKTSWGGVSSWYDDLLREGNDTYQEKVIAPNILRLLKGYKGKRVLDLACGQGYFSRLLHSAGSDVVGVDVSRELIGLALKQSHKDIEFHVSPAHELPFLKNCEVDAIVIVLAIQNIEEVQDVLKECSRVLQIGGKIFIVMNHPAFRIPKRSSWGFDEKNNIQYRRLDAYLSESKEAIDMHPGSGGASQTISFHRSLQYYMKHLCNSEFLISRCEEWTSHKKSEKGPRAVSEDRARKEFPLFLMLEAVKFETKTS